MRENSICDKDERHIYIYVCIFYTRSCEGGIEAVEVLPLPFWTIMFDDFLCAEVMGSMRRSNQARKKNFFDNTNINCLCEQ